MEEPARGRKLSGRPCRQKIEKRSDIVNIGSFLLIRNPSRKTVMRLAQTARHLGREVCFDPNLRISQWKNHGEVRRVMMAMIRRSTIVRLNDEETFFFTKTRKMEKAARQLRKQGPRLVVITLRSNGCYFQSGTSSGLVPGFRVKVVDTTGCGDGFLAGLLHGLALRRKNPEAYTAEELFSIYIAANAVGALVATKRGGIAGMPSRNELSAFLSKARVN